MDITMCTSTECPVRKTCYRAQAKPDRLQSYSNFEYTCHENNGFKHYIQLTVEEIKQQSSNQK